MPFAHLNLTDDQRASVRTILHEERTASEATHKALREARRELHAAIFASATPDAAKIEELTTKISNLEADALRARIASRVKISSVLTDEQRKQMASTEGRRFGPRGRGRR
jgi:Spy/CpxP family protein refolding chaperone